MTSPGLLTAGWKPVSLVDVHQETSFTVWLCGCNLKCPFCHNWRIATNQPGVCRLVPVSEIFEEAYSARFLVNYVHLTGGEPLLQHDRVAMLLKGAGEIGLKRSVNSNLTLLKPLEKLLIAELVDHVATDLKVPYRELYGLPESSAKKLWERYVKAIELISSVDVALELRIPVYRGINISHVGEVLKLLQPYLSKLSGLVTLVQPLLGEPVTSPRNPSWCRDRCNPPREELEEVADVVRSLGLPAKVIYWGVSSP